MHGCYLPLAGCDVLGRSVCAADQRHYNNGAYRTVMESKRLNVTKRSADGDLAGVTGNLQAGDIVVRRATFEIRERMPIQAWAQRPRNGAPA